ncbi:MAG: flavodoxin [Candidatus Omnitrophica bacterium]|nr:flavodoxin [Candidatus Omnitrophota bacterium]
MKALIAYYSFSGNTHRAAQSITDFLKAKNICSDIARLKPEREPEKFIHQALDAFMAKKAKVSLDCFVDLSGYDLIFLGTPVWAFAPAPALRDFISRSDSFHSKPVCLFATYGSGLGKDRCLDKMEKLVRAKNGNVVSKILISDKKVKDPDYLQELFSKKITI